MRREMVSASSRSGAFSWNLASFHSHCLVVKATTGTPSMVGVSDGMRSVSCLCTFVTVASATISIFARSSERDMSESRVPTRSSEPGTLKA